MSEVEQIYYISDDEDDEDDDGDNDGDDEDEGRPGASQPHLRHTCLYLLIFPGHVRPPRCFL